jgi:hypothetical protein
MSGLIPIAQKARDLITDKDTVAVSNADGSRIGSAEPSKELEIITLDTGGAGTTGSLYLRSTPIYNSNGSQKISYDDSSFEIITGTALTNFVETAGLVLNNGDYFIEAFTGLLTYQKASVDTIHEVSYLSGSQNVKIQETKWSKLQNADDLQLQYSFLDPSTPDQRVNTITYTSANLGISAVETFTYSGGSGNYYIDTITRS